MPQFDPDSHIRNVLVEVDTRLRHSNGSILPGITGRAGAAADGCIGVPIGVDRIILEPGSEFHLHTHPGDHLVYVLASRGFIHVDGHDFLIRAGDTVYIPACYPHGVKTDAEVAEPLEILAFGVPHVPLGSRIRMTVVPEKEGPPSTASDWDK